MTTNYKKVLSILGLAFLFLQGAPSSMAQTDGDLAARITAAINREKTLEGLPIAVVSVNGFVLLTGQALDEKQKLQASSTTAGVGSSSLRRLINEIVIVEAIDTNFATGDAALVQKIKDEISSVTTNTTVVVHNGIVHLLGALPRDESGLVADKVSRIAGVKSIKLSFEIIAN